VIRSALLAFVALLLACRLAADEPFITLQSTTSTQNSGLFDHILPLFTAQTGIATRVVAVGTGQAIRNASNGDGDVLLVHSTADEEAFVAQGHGLARADVMYNDFVIVGPSADLAGTKDAPGAVAALRRIAAAKAPFLSRGDNSGTHKAEMRLWAQAQVDVAGLSGAWYREAGAGMGAALNIAIGTGAYILTDRATWISFGNKGDHAILLDNDPALFNQYGVVVVDPARHPNVKAGLAQTFADWIVSPNGQAAIAGFKVDGQQLFFPNANGP
jgi:tungstate transport system substrate-binding protein